MRQWLLSHLEGKKPKRQEGPKAKDIEKVSYNFSWQELASGNWLLKATNGPPGYDVISPLGAMIFFRFAT